MKNFKKISAVLFAVLLIAGAAFAFSASAEEIDGIVYTLKSGRYAVLGVSSAFAGGDITIPAEIDGKPVEEISERAFESNTSLGSVSLPASIKKINKYAFSNCPGIRSVTFSESENYVSILEGAFSGCENLADVTFPKHIYSIPTECFRDCALTSVTIPDGTDAVNSRAFINNSALEEVFIPSSVTSIGEDAFFGCTSLAGFYLPGGNDNFKQVSGALLSADGTEFIQYPLGKAATAYSVPAGVTDIGSGAFAFSALKKVTVTEGVEEIGRAAFSNSTALEAVTFPSTLRKIGQNAFYQCKALKSVTIPGSVTDFSDAFYASGVETVIIESGIKTIPNDSFTNCKSLKNVTIPDTVTKIGSAFCGCSSLSEIYIPAGVTDIAYDAFSGCDNLTIKADEGSYALQYAIDNNIPYEINQGGSDDPDDPQNPDTPDTPDVNVILSVPGNQTAEYRSKVTVVATAKNLPDNCRIVISADGKTSSGKAKASLTIDEIKSTAVFTVKVLDGSNKVVANSDGTALQKEVKVEVNSGFFAKIIAWFKALFRILPEYTFEP